MRKKKVGLLGGTFDPIHLGHLNLAIELKEKKQLDEVWFVLAALNPHKLEKPPISIEHRLKMLELALKDLPFARIESSECFRNHPSYTVDTLKDLLKRYDHEFYLLLGEDALSGFFKWHKPEEIVSLVPLFVGSRRCDRVVPEKRNDPVVKALEAGLTYTNMMDVSSTEVRDRLGKGLYCGHLVPQDVLSYIKQNHLYST